MKTVLIKVTGYSNEQFSELLERIGLINLTRTEKGKPIKFNYIDGISGKPEFIGEYIHTWSKFDHVLGMWKYHRIDLTEKGEQILKNNNLEYFHEIVYDVEIEDDKEKNIFVAKVKQLQIL